MDVTFNYIQSQMPASQKCTFLMPNKCLIEFEHPADKYMSFCFDIYLPTYTWTYEIEKTHFKIDAVCTPTYEELLEEIKVHIYVCT